MKKLLLLAILLVCADAAHAVQCTECQAPPSGDTVAFTREATFQGGDVEKFAEWAQRHVRYPEMAMQRGIQGRVWVSFTITPNGTLHGVMAMNDADPMLIEESVRVIALSPRWEPAVQGLMLKDGTIVEQKFVNSTLKLPMTFFLDGGGNEPMTFDDSSPFETATMFEYDDVALKPTFQSGEPEKFARWLQQNVKLPKRALKRGNVGAVVILTVFPDGSVRVVQVLTLAGDDAKDAIESVARTSPRWEPGGTDPQTPATVTVIIPVEFR